MVSDTGFTALLNKVLALRDGRGALPVLPLLHVA
jgi:hypothetical protein